ncbi:hypothetical protein FRB90_011460 [Tulasnella sp. 427]|nr:hypothetical protein FRB90_011460 [Tulasnella sp. 427]
MEDNLGTRGSRKPRAASVSAVPAPAPRHKNTEQLAGISNPTVPLVPTYQRGFEERWPLAVDSMTRSFSQSTSSSDAIPPVPRPTRHLYASVGVLPSSSGSPAQRAGEGDSDTVAAGQSFLQRVLPSSLFSSPFALNIHPSPSRLALDLVAIAPIPRLNSNPNAPIGLPPSSPGSTVQKGEEGDINTIDGSQSAVQRSLQSSPVSSPVAEQVADLPPPTPYSASPLPQRKIHLNPAKARELQGRRRTEEARLKRHSRKAAAGAGTPASASGSSTSPPIEEPIPLVSKPNLSSSLMKSSGERSNSEHSHQQLLDLKADQLVKHYFTKLVSVIQDARSVDFDCHVEVADSEDFEFGGDNLPSTLVGETTTQHKQPVPKMDKSLNLETLKWGERLSRPSSGMLRGIISKLLMEPTNSVANPPPVIIQIILFIPSPSPGEALFLEFGGHRTRITSAPRYVLLESWRVDILSRSDSDTAIPHASMPRSTGGTVGSAESDLPATYKQCVILFRSVYTLLRILPAWTLHCQLRAPVPETGSGNRMALELRVIAPRQSSIPSTPPSEELGDRVASLGFESYLPQHPSADKVQQRTFPPIKFGPIELHLSLEHRVEVKFVLGSEEIAQFSDPTSPSPVDNSLSLGDEVTGYDLPSDSGMEVAPVLSPVTLDRSSREDIINDRTRGLSLENLREGLDHSPDNSVETPDKSYKSLSAIILRPRFSSPQPLSPRSESNKGQDVAFHDLFLIEKASTPLTQYAIDLIVAIAKALPNVLRNKHRLYRLTLRARDICNHLHWMANTEDPSADVLDNLKQFWEILNSLEGVLLKLGRLVSEESTTLDLSMLASWENASATLNKIRDELYARPFDICKSIEWEGADQDKYFDDCSWASIILHQGIEVPVRQLQPDEDETVLEAQNVIENLGYLVDQMKLDGVVNEDIRKLFIGIISDVALMTMQGSEDAPLDFWNVVDRALSVSLDTTDTAHRDWKGVLRDSWSDIVNLWIRPAQPHGNEDISSSSSASQIHQNKPKEAPLAPWTQL